MFRNFLNSRGFTLVEVLASVVLLAVVISLTLSIFPNMFRTNDVNEQSLDAVAVAKDALVKAKSGGYKDQLKAIPNAVADSETEIEGVITPVGYRFYFDTTNYGDLSVAIIVNPSKVDSLDLYETTIYVLDKNNIRAKNYGYLNWGNFNDVSP